ncbi:MAG TPA: DUF1003 domain-containing protein [Dehalococcoidia bacterium]|nr:DUF1003 domain-containing protein [Dehalococcoidia bacterium]
MSTTRHHQSLTHLAAPFGADQFGQTAERLARFFGTPAYLLTQTALVIAWIAVNAVAAGLRWDPYPFILLNLAFSTQAAYAAPLILLAQTRQAQRDKAWSDADVQHREDLQQQVLILLRQNTEITQHVAALTQEVQRLTEEIHQRIVNAGSGA